MLEMSNFEENKTGKGNTGKKTNPGAQLLLQP